MKRIFYLLFCFPVIAQADLPLSLEDVLTDKGKFKLDTSVSYINGESRKSDLAAPIYIQTGNASFIPIPTDLQEKERNSDMFVGTLGLRYGLTGNTDLYGSMSYLWREERTFDGETAQSDRQRDKYLSDVSLGISHTFLKDDKNPALIGFVEGNAYEKSRDKASSGKSWLLGATTYKAIDPIVLSLTTAYRFNGSKRLSEGQKFKAGNYWLFNPNIAFAANDRISLTGGVQWLGSQPSRLDGRRESVTNTATYAHFGVGFGFTKTTSLNVSARFKISGQNASELKLGMQHTF